MEFFPLLKLRTCWGNVSMPVILYDDYWPVWLNYQSNFWAESKREMMLRRLCKVILENKVEYGS